MILISCFPSLYECIVMLLFMLGNFYWMTDTVNFTLLGVGYFCIPINILDFFFLPGIQLFRNTLILLGLDPIFLGKTEAILNEGLIFPHYRRKTFLCTLSNAPWIMKVFQYVLWEQVLLLAVCDCLAPLPLVLLGSFFLQPHVVSSHACTNHYSAKYPVGALLRFSECSLLAAFSFPVSCPTNSSCLNLSDPQPHPSTQGVHCIILVFSSLFFFKFIF